MRPGDGRRETRALRRWAAASALALALGAFATMIVVAAVDYPRGTVGLLLIGLAVTSAWYGIVRKGALHVLGFAAGGLLIVTAVWWGISNHPALIWGVICALGLALGAASYAFRTRVELPWAQRPAHPVLFWNPRSGGGKAARCHLEHEARARGIEPIELSAGKNLEELARSALDEGADALAVAGGDGSQAIVARIAAERGVPFACIPAGTRNHFALDLGVDRSDVVGALDAFVDGGERLVDLGEVNGRIFVNNASLGLYGEAVQRAGYRDAKVRTLFETVPDIVGPSEHPELQWRSPDGKRHEGGLAVVVSNNRYRLGNVLGDGTRPRLDEGVLGVVVLGVPGEEPGVQIWATNSYEVNARAPVPAGVDGEAVVFDPPLLFRIRPRALRCRVARHHPGASPSALLPQGPWDMVRTLARIAAGHEPHDADAAAEPPAV